jgi:hypothetical protein
METSFRPSPLCTSIGAILAIAAVSIPAVAAVKVDTSELREAVTVDGVRTHQAAFQAAADAHGGTREASTEGYFESVDYVAGLLGYCRRTPKSDESVNKGLRG